MYMDIHETGKYGGVMKINDTGGDGGRHMGGDGNNTALTDPQLRAAKGAALNYHGVFQYILHDSSILSGPQATQCIPFS